MIEAVLDLLGYLAAWLLYEGILRPMLFDKDYAPKERCKCLSRK